MPNVPDNALTRKHTSSRAFCDSITAHIAFLRLYEAEGCESNALMTVSLIAGIAAKEAEVRRERRSA